MPGITQKASCSVKRKVTSSPSAATTPNVLMGDHGSEM
ncbi:hypothetical protein PAAG_12171 [Paracoccidioides lutzii Pb01]|uniref:Uncharacterized protein n=1 Tax=Paracoccidioides lutzii (strain ATCC MYA-826 / Pb01) TaxID=502779 RepID=A0A0A2V0W8_PARBA|nr:hypothetical protein PAAG_12171 [Paracoccidioides lutzii Pb01]KGQ01133.1 hypothetical protein PAAG_12171 [Paracoccidioides lutzii Pb01]